MTPVHVAAAAKLYASRRIRDDVFGFDKEGFGEPGWDMLLALVAQGAMTASQLVASAAAPQTIAVTYLDWLVSRGLISLGDQSNVALADRGRRMMATYLDHEVRGA